MTSISARLTLYYAAAATISAALLFLSGYLMLESRLVHGLDELNAAEFGQLKTRLGRDYHSLTPRQIDDRIRDSADAASALFYINVDEPRTGMVFFSHNLQNRSIPDVKGLHNYSVELPGTGEVRVGEFVMPPYDVTIATPMAPVRASMRGYAVVCAGLLLTMLFTSAGIGLALSRVILRPLIFIRQTANRISSDNLGERIPLPQHQDELADLTRLLNRMFDRLEQSFNQIKRFAAEASHELKTPLSLIRLHGERLLEVGELSMTGTEAAIELLEEVARLNQIIDEMLFLSRAEAHAIPLVLTVNSPEEMLRNIEQDVAVLAEHRARAFRLDLNGSGEVACEERWLRQVWLNVLTNALAATPEGGLVTMTSGYEADQWRVTIDDEGAGLPEDELERIFDRFSQFGSPERRAMGSGLGLAIARSIVDLHQGTIHAANRTDRAGLRITVTLPIRQTAIA